jgi:hypothetical protein
LSNNLITDQGHGEGTFFEQPAMGTKGCRAILIRAIPIPFAYDKNH